MGLISVQSVACPRSVLTRIFGRQISTPESVALVFVFLVHFSEAAVIICRYPTVVMVLVAHADLKFASLRLL